MTAPLPGPNDIVFILPSGAKFLGEALVPVAKNLRLALARKVRSSGPEFVTIDDLSRHMGVLGQAFTHWSPRLDDLMRNVIQDQSAGMAEAYRAAGRLEQVISEFVDGYQMVQTSHAGPEASQPRMLLLGVYRHYMKQICDWLEDVVQVTANPRSAIEKRGLLLKENVELSVVLKLTTPPEMAKLHELVAKMQVPVEPEPEIEPPARNQPPPSTGPGIMGAIGALAFGIGVSKAVLGRRHS